MKKCANVMKWILTVNDHVRDFRFLFALFILTSQCMPISAIAASETNELNTVSMQVTAAVQLISNKDYPQAISALEHLLQNYPDDYATQRNLGLAYYMNGDETKALYCWEKLLEELPNDALLKNNVAWIYGTTTMTERRDPAKAVQLCHDAILLDPLKYRYWNTLSETYNALGFYSLAYQCSVTSLKMAQRFEPGTEEMAMIENTVHSFRQLSDTDRGCEDTPAIKDALYWQSLAAYEKKNGNLAATLGAYLLAESIDPDDAATQFGIATCYMGYNMHREAVTLFEHLADQRPDDYSLLNNLAWLYATSPDISLRDGNTAIKYAQKALMIAPDNYHVWSTLAEAYYLKGEYQSAKKAAKATIDMADAAGASSRERQRYQKQHEKCAKASDIMSIID
ncbi:MAG: tetratricopeptide repeat protein [Spartobacteria bacterium]|nr:tetratricopeptide repeat protein [Spartobacteria bacterium]